jgi:hypothetical protein
MTARKIFTALVPLAGVMLLAQSAWAAAPDETDLGADAAMSPSKLSIYGFMDFGFNKFYTTDKSSLLTLFPSEAGTFVLGNVNLFFDAQPYDKWRSLFEVRFTNLPHGYERSLATPLGGQYVRDDSEISDFTSPSIRGTVIPGSIIIERAQTEYAVSDSFKLMAGYFFTPFGIWNVDHGTPTLISLLLPSFQADDYLPSHQLGVQAFGSFYTPSWEFGYHAYVANNRTPSQVDFANNKSFGGRLFASSTGSAIKTKIGVSGYYGHSLDIERKVQSYQPYVVATDVTISGTEKMVGADLSVDAGPLRLRTEGLLRRIDYEPGKRGGNPDSWYSNGYVLAAYQLPWAGIEPFAYFEAIHFVSSLGDTVLLPSAGVNVHFNPNVQLKTQVGRALFYDYVTKESRTPSDNNVTNVAARLVVSF